MIKALLYKEWLKTRWVVAFVSVVAVLLHIYIFARINKSFNMVGREHIWDIVVNRNQFLFSDILWFPLLSGLLISLFQFIPEVNQKRFKLTLHLPLRERSVILWTTGYGAGMLILLYLIQLAFFFTSVNKHFPAEILASTAITIFPWYLSGISIYFLAAAICIEPSWKRKLILAFISLGIIRLFHISSFPGSYEYMVGYITLMVVISTLVTSLSVYRFKVGVQD